MTKAKAKKVGVSKRAVLARVNRKLAADGEALRAYRTYQPRGEYYHIDLNKNWLIAEFTNLEPFAREIGVLKPWEKLEE